MDPLKSLNLHLENFLPGIFTLVLIVYLSPSFAAAVSKTTENPILANELVRGTAFVSVAYLLGVVVVAFCRVLDKFSELGPRCWALHWLAIEKPEIDGTGIKRIKSANSLYRNRIKAAISGTETEIKVEIAKRRERLHLLRSTLVPAMLSVWVLQLDWSLKVALTMVSAVVILFLYAYLEVAVYDEACLSKSGSIHADSI